MQTSCLPPPSFPPLTEVNLTVEGSVVKRLRFIQKPPCKRCLKFFEYLIQATSQSAEIVLMQTFRLPPPSIPPLKGEGSVRKLLLFSKAGFSKIFISFWISSTGAFSVCGKKYWCKHHVCPSQRSIWQGEGIFSVLKTLWKYNGCNLKITPVVLNDHKLFAVAVFVR